jgi:hypothetical protein
VGTAFGAAAAGLRAVIFVSTDCQPEKLALMTQAGGWVFQVREGYAAAVDLSRAAARTFGWLDRNTGVNPLTLEAKTTVAFEVWEQLGRRVPDLMIAPVGDGPTLVALDKGFAELVGRGLAERRPRLVGVQAEACQPLVRAWLGAAAGPAELDPAATVADGIAVVRPAIGDAVLEAVATLARRRASAPSRPGRRPWPDWSPPSKAAWRPARRPWCCWSPAGRSRWAGRRPAWAGSRSWRRSTRSSGRWRAVADGQPAVSSRSADRSWTTTGRGLSMARAPTYPGSGLRSRSWAASPSCPG